MKRIGELTAEEIAGLKTKHGKVVEVEVEDCGEKYVGYFRRPSMDTISAMMAESKRDEVKALEILFENTYISGCQEFRTDAVVKVAAMTQLGSLVGGCVAKLKNL